jgi:predicted transcriptional regulator
MTETKKGPRRNPLQRERQRLECLDLYIAGERQHEIAAKLHMSQSQVSRDIHAAHDDWRKRTVYNLDEQKAKRLAEIDLLERQYHQAWRRSIGTHKTTTKEQAQLGTENGAGKLEGLSKPVEVKTVTKSEKLAGEVAYLNGVAWCISERCRILGTYAATKQITAQVPPKLLAAAQIDSL